MLKNKIWLGIILSIILLVFSINGFTAYYKYTQESGTNFYVGTGDKADALEDTNEMRQIIDDLGALLVHSKRDGIYPKGGDFGGTIQIPEAGLKFSNDPVNNDIAAYIAGEMAWQTKAELGLDLSLYYLKTEIDTQGEVETIWGVSLVNDGDLDLYYLKTAIDTLGEVETIYSADIIDDAELATALTDYYLKTAIDTLGEVETIYSKDIIDSDELAALKFTDLDDTPANYTDQAGKYVKVNAGETALEFGTPAGGAGTYLELTDTPAAYDTGKYAKSTADGVVWDDPAGSGDMTKAVYDTDADDIVDKAETIDDGAGNSSTAADVKDAVTKKHSQNTDTDLDATFEATFVKKADTINVLSDITSAGADIEDAVTKKHTQNTDTILVFTNALADDHTYSGEVDSQSVGESVVFGDLLYFNWTDVEWKKAKADAFGTTPALRIALESKADGETCLMLVKGYIRDDSAFDFGASRIFLNDDTAGTCDDIAPAESGDQIQIVGTAIHADILFFNPSMDVGEI